jgi:predicted nucleotidyltransferase
VTEKTIQLTISDSVLDQIRAVVAKFPEIESVIIFGSRVMNSAKPGSDIDLCISGSKVTHDTVSLLSYYLLNETTIPVNIDVVHFESISNAALREHIEQYGVEVSGEQGAGKRASG